MNYLAHAYLSFNHPALLVGNMISDHVKGKKQYDYPADIQKGIRLHRAIDAFTDDHAITRELKKFFTPVVRLYSGAFVDIVYDHFLALHSPEMNEQQWMDFTQHTYRILEEQQAHFPEPFARMFPYMQQQNWLFNYRYTWGIENSFGGLVRRARYLDSSSEAFAVFTEHYAIIEHSSALFIADVKKFAGDQFQELIHQ
jgi:acyl carrier protein phosphodiesterase